MASNGANPTWRSWSLSTKLTVGVGLLAAAGVVVFLYLPYLTH